MIRKFKKCGLYVLLFVVFSTVLFLGFSNKVNAATVYDDLFDTRGAWLVKNQNHSTGLQIENVLMQRLSESISNDCIDALNFLDTNSQSNNFWQFAVMNENPTQTSYSSSWYFGSQSIALTAEPFTNTGTSGQRSFRIDSGQFTGERYHLQYTHNSSNQDEINLACFKNSTQNVSIASYTPAGPQAGTRTYSIFVSSNIDIIYPSGYEGNTPYNEDNLPGALPGIPDCSALDFGCWLSGLIETLDETLSAVVEAILKAITWLFVPNTDGLHARLQDIVDTMADRFGVLWLPNDLLIHYFELFVTGDPLNWSQPNHYPCNATDNSNNPFGTSFVSFFGHTTRLNDIIPYCKALGYGGNYGPLTTYINYLIIFFRISLLMAVLRLFYKKIHEEIIV